MELLFGGIPDVARFVLAFLLVLGLIGAGAFLWRKFGVGPLSTIGPRGRQPRLAVIDAASVDGRRRLVLIRRDNAEHLIMIGGPTDVVIETNISRTGVTSVSREPRPIPAADSASRQPASVEGPGWMQPFEPATRPIRSTEDLDAVSAEPAARTAREAMVDSMRAVRSEPAVRRSPAAQFPPPADDGIAAPVPIPPPVARPAHAPADLDSVSAEPATRTAREAMADSMRAVRSEPVARRSPAMQFQPPANDGIAAPALILPPVRSPEDLDAVAAEPAKRAARETMVDSIRAARSDPAARRSPAAAFQPPPEDEMTAPALAPPPIPPETNFQTPAAPEPRRPSPPPPPPVSGPAPQAAPPEPQRLPSAPGPVSPSTGVTEPKRMPAPPARQSQSDESNLAEMAQRLEAALRRPVKPAGPPAPIRPAARLEPSAARRAAYFEALNAPKASVRAPEPLAAPPPDLKALSGKDRSESQTPFESLEDEMAKMLGRSPGGS